MEEIVSLAIKGGVTLVQLRDKHSTTRELLQIGKRLKSILSAYKVPLIINDRIDIAIALEADGVHLGQSDMPCDIARKILGSEKIIGLTVNTLSQVESTQQMLVDYLGVGPVFATKTKVDAGEPWSMEELQRLRKISQHILIGIGGINLDNIHKVLGFGFDGVAVVSAICTAEDPQQAAMQLSNMMKNFILEQRL